MDRKQKKVNIDGKRYSIYYHNDREYRQKYKQLLARLEKQEVLSESFKAVAESWADEHFEKIEHYTAEGYKRPLADVLEWFSDCQITDIKPRDIQFRLDLMARQQYARQTINLRKIVLNQIFQFAIFNELLTVNPCDAVKVPKGAGRTERESPSPDVLKTITEHATDDWISFYIFLAAVTGCRKSEILALYPSDFNFNKMQIQIHSAVIYENNTPIIRPYGKSAKSSRIVPILPLFADIMKSYVRECKNAPVVNFEGETPNKGKFDRALRKYQAENNLKITSHQLRHLYCSLLAQSGIPLKQAQKIMGHSKIETTLNIYTHALGEIETDKIEATFGKHIV